MADGKIHIIITDQIGAGGGGTGGVDGSSGSSTKTSTSKNQNGLAKYAEHEFIHLAKNTAMQYINYSISNIGNFTGDYISQANTQAALNNVTKLVGIGTAVAAGAKIGSAAMPGVGTVVGAAIGLVAGTAGSIVSFEQQEKVARVQYAKTNREIAMLRDLSGLNVLTNGGRNEL